MKKSLIQRVVTRSRFLAGLATLLACVLACATAVAQDGNVAYPENSIDSRLRTSARVDPTTGALQLQISLGNYPGRGGAGLPVTLYYSSKLWRLEHLSTTAGAGELIYARDSVYGAFYAESSAAGWTSNLDWFLWPSGESPLQTYDEMGRAADASGSYVLARMYVRLPDGSKHELRRDDAVWNLYNNYNQAGVYYSVDGSRLRYETATQTLYLPDGSRYVGNTQFIDRNGNTLTYDYSARTWTDTLGRQIGLPLPALSTTGEQYDAQARDESYTLPGYNEAPRTFTFRWRRLADVRTDPSQPLLSKGDRVSNQSCEHVPSLFASPVYCGGSDDDHRLMSTSPFNPVVLHQIVYPDGSTYTFTYNVYGEIDKVAYPTGGYEKFTHGGFPDLSAHFTSSTIQGFYQQGNRGVSARRVSADGTQAGEALWTYTGGLTSRVTAPDGVVTERRLYASAGELVAYGFDDPRAGLAYDERVYAYDGGPMLRRKLTQWQVDGAVQYFGGRVMYKTRNPRPLKEVEVLLDTGGNALASTTTYTYDSDLNVTSMSRHAHVEVDQTTAQTGAIDSFPAGALLRREETDYLTNDQNYRARNLLSLPTETRVKDASGAVVARTEIRYDEATYAPLPCGASVGWSDPGMSARGNATTTRRWLDPGNTWVEQHAQYDGCGSPRKAWDARGNLSQVEYSSAYHYAYPTQVTSPVPDPTGLHGSNTALTTSTAYDLSTGLVTKTTDANLKETTFEYNDPLNRLRKVNRPDGGYTSYDYGNNVYGHYVRTQTKLDTTGTLTDAYQYFDGLGRPYRSFAYDPQEPSAPWQTTDIEYDSLGRVKRASLPYRSTGSDQALFSGGKWTETTYDVLGRVKTVTTRPDNAAVTTDYSGSQVTATDQAGRKRRSVTDALGRLTSVTEAPEVVTCQPDGAGCTTSYTYDALGNLRKVDQGGQLRFFMYDSLGRLIRAKNPEQSANGALALTDPVTGNSQWSLSYAYDAAGNLTSRTDARGVTSVYGYDALNRSATVSYSDSTPAVKRIYDGAANGRGRLHADWTWDGSSVYYTHTAVDNYDAAGRALNQRRHFYVNNVAGPAFTVQRTYDLAGNVTSQTYPSGRTVNYSYDAAGRLSTFTGNLGDGTLRTYADQVRYDEGSRMQQERFGTTTPVYNKSFYNVRGQLSEIRVSTYSITTPGQETNWNRGAIINHYSDTVWAGSDQYNNGNLKKQEIYVPNDDAITGYWHRAQFYTYDSLNRLDVASESGSQGWQQDYSYDRFGNRQINPGGTSGGVPATQFSVDTNTNRLGVPAGSGSQMTYDNAGNLVTDTYTGTGARSFDAEGRMTAAQWFDGQVRTASYTYDADGRRVKRTNGLGTETWQVYGMSGELLAEYAPNSSPTTPQKEYGYRAGELLVMAEAPTSSAAVPSGLAASPASGGTTVSLDWAAASGATNYRVERRGEGQSNYSLAGTSTTTHLDDGGVTNGFAYLYRVCAANAAGECTSAYSNLALATVYSFIDDPIVPGVTQVKAQHFTELREAVNAVRRLAGLGNAAWGTGLSPQVTVIGVGQVEELRARLGEALSALGVAAPTYEDSTLVGAPAGTVIKRAHVAQLRVGATRGVGASGGGGGGGGTTGAVRWMVADQLGTPRMIIDLSGSLAGVKRHDYLPFGEELTQGGRTAQQGYAADNVRQKFTGHERDNETGLDYMQARYYASAQGRFISVDPYDIILERQSISDAREANSIFNEYISEPQHWNRYAYVLNNPLKYIDPTGASEEEIKLRLNIIYDSNTIKTEERARELAGKAIDDAIKTFATAGITLEVTFTKGSGDFQMPTLADLVSGPGVSGTIDSQYKADGAINAFISEDRSQRTGGFITKGGDIFLNYGVDSSNTPRDLSDNALSHEIGHKLGRHTGLAKHNFSSDYSIDSANSKLRKGEKTERIMTTPPGKYGRNSTHVMVPSTQRLPMINIYREGARRVVSGQQ